MTTDCSHLFHRLVCPNESYDSAIDSIEEGGCDQLSSTLDCHRGHRHSRCWQSPECQPPQMDRSKAVVASPVLLAITTGSRRGASHSHSSNLVYCTEHSTAFEDEQPTSSSQQQQQQQLQQVSMISSPAATVAATSSPLRSSRSFTTTSYRQRPNVTRKFLFFPPRSKTLEGEKAAGWLGCCLRSQMDRTNYFAKVMFMQIIKDVIMRLTHHCSHNRVNEVDNRITFTSHWPAF